MTYPNALSRWLDEHIGDDALYSSNAEVAEAIGVSEATVRRVRYGHLPTLRILQKFENLPGLDFSDVQQMIGLIHSESDEGDEPPDSELAMLVEDLKQLRGTPLYHPALHAIQQVIVALLYKLDPPPDPED